MSATVTGAEAVEWDLTDLYAGPDDPRWQAELDGAIADATAFRERYHGRVAELDAEGIAAGVAELERIRSVVLRAGVFARLRYAADASDQSRGAQAQRAQEAATAVETALLFFDLEWAAIPDEHAEEILATPELEHYANVLRSERRYRPFLLSEPEERLDAEKEVTGAAAWTRLFSDQIAELRIQLGDEDLALDEAIARLSQEPEQDERRRVAEAVTETLRPGARTRGFILNTIANERAIEDRLRGFSTWVSARNLSNEIPDQAVASLIEAIVSRYDIPHRYYGLKARMLGLPKLYDFDRFAPLEGANPRVPWDEARGIVVDAFTAFSPEAGEIVDGFFEHRWIDAALRHGKVSGAFCSTIVPDAHPYVFMNYAGERRSVLTLAHELGHGLHGVLAQPLGLLNARTPLTLAETASVFGEALTFSSLLEREDDPAAQLHLLTGRIEDAIATTFRQVALNRFEDAVHTARRDEGELPVERLRELWTAEQRRVLGDAVEVTDGYGIWWSYIPHFIGSPGYVYAYAFGYLFALAIYGRYAEEGDALVDPILDLLRAGGSAPPAELAARVGFDLDDAAFWAAGIDAIGRLVDEAEELADRVGLR